MPGDGAGEDRPGAPEAVLAPDQGAAQMQRRLAEEERVAVPRPIAPAQIEGVAVEVIEIAQALRVALVEDVEETADGAQVDGTAGADQIARPPVGDPHRVVGVLAPEEEIGAGHAAA